MVHEQLSFKGEGFEVSVETIIANKEKVVDFFGDNRAWYEKLLKGGATFIKTSLDSQEGYDIDIVNDEDVETDMPPLDPTRVTEGRATNISKFFTEYPLAREAFIQYSK